MSTPDAGTDSQIVTSFDPRSAAQGVISNPLPGGVGTMVIYNDSPVSLIFQYAGQFRSVPASVVDVIDLEVPVFQLLWMSNGTLTNAAAAPISLVTINGYSGQPAARGKTRRYPYQLARILNVGGM